MSNIRTLFDPNLGIQTVLDSQVHEALPEAQQLASAILREASITDVYTATNMKAFVEALICPPAGDGEILQADNFSRALENCANELKDSSHPHVQTFLKEVLLPLLENEELLKAYCGLMIEG